MRRAFVRPAVLAAALVGTTPRASAQEAPSRAQPSPVDVHVSSEYASYADTDHVFVQTPAVSATVSNPTAGWSVDGLYLVDVVSAASVDIVSTASQRWTEVRQGGALEGQYKPAAFGVSANGAVSSEPDYLSLSGGGALTLDALDKNYTGLLGFEHTHDVAGRTGTPFSVFSRSIDREAFKGGLTALLGRATVGALLADVVVENGDQSKVYRFVPLFSPGTAVPVGAPIDQVNALRVPARPLEQLPLFRDRFALTARVAHRFHRWTLRLEQRLYADTWDLRATTTDVRALFDAGRRVETGPHVRAHGQTGVVFWRRAYVLEAPFDYPAYRTGDRELGPLVNGTAGWSLRVKIGANPAPEAWTVGLDFNATWTQYLDDLYVTQRVSALGGITLEAQR